MSCSPAARASSSRLRAAICWTQGGDLLKERRGALSDDDRRVLAFVDEFERRFVGQEDQRRSIEETLDLAWDLLARFPRAELRRIRPELVERHHPASP